MSQAFAVVLRQYYLLRGSPSRMLPMVAWGGIDIVLWGFITKYLSTVTSPGLNLLPALLGAALFWHFFTRVMQGVTTAFFEDVWSRNFLNIFATPLRIREYVGGLVLSGIASSAIGMVVMVLLATLLFGLSFFVYGIGLFPFIAVLFLFGIALGIFGCAIVLRLGPSSEWFVWPIPGIISPFVGVFYPLTTLPQWMRYPAYLLPPSYVFEGMRAVVLGHTFAPGGLVVGLVLAVGYIFLAAWFFARIHRYAVRTGLIARYSAESVS